MSVLERLQQRFSRASTTNRPSESSSLFTKRIPNANHTPVEQPPPPDHLINSDADKLIRQEVTLNNFVSGYDSSQVWASPPTQPSRIPPGMSNSCSHPSLPNALTNLGFLTVKPKTLTDQERNSYHPALQQSQETLSVHNTMSTSVTQSGSRGKRAKTPLSSFYRVSSDEDEGSDEEEEEEIEEEEDETADISNQTEGGKTITSAAFERRSQRLRRSIDRAKAALPADFADRIEISPIMKESSQHEPSVSQLQKPPNGVGNLSTEDLQAHLSDHSSDCQETCDGDKMINLESGSRNNIKSNEDYLPDGPKVATVEETPEVFVAQPTDDPTSVENSKPTSVNRSADSKIIIDCVPQTGITWRSGPAKPLSELMPEFRSGSHGTTYLMRAICKRTGCRCALRNYDNLMLFTAPDSILASATWEMWTHVGKSTKTFSPSISEVQAKLILFRQCRGWYEVLNENHQPIPHLTTLEQVRRTRASTFMVRQDFKCLVAPPTLVIPHISEFQKTSDGPPPPLIPSSVIAQATSAEVLSNCKPDFVRAGTLLRYITYLPHCTLKRGKKTKELGLILVVERPVNLSKYQTKNIELDPVKSVTRVLYLGVEDCTPAIFPPKISISPIAGPDNISGVHLISSLLRKFRLPVSIRPTPLPETYNIRIDSINNQNNNSVISYQPVNNSNLKINCGLTSIQSLLFTEKHYLRLQSLYRGDILIIAPIASPERLFLITPSMLSDHVFQLGSSQDLAFLTLLENHRIQSSNFLAMAHPQETLDYLIRHMVNTTREHRDSYAARLQSKQRSDVGEPPESYMTQEEIFRAYDELDEIYFYIRHGYYPSKLRKPEDGTEKTDSRLNTRSQKFTHSSEDFQTELNNSKDTPTGQTQMGMSTAVELLAASLNKSTYNTNSINYRVQPKEYGI